MDKVITGFTAFWHTIYDWFTNIDLEAVGYGLGIISFCVLFLTVFIYAVYKFVQWEERGWKRK